MIVMQQEQEQLQRRLPPTIQSLSFFFSLGMGKIDTQEHTEATVPVTRLYISWHPHDTLNSTFFTFDWLSSRPKQDETPLSLWWIACPPLCLAYGIHQNTAPVCPLPRACGRTVSAPDFRPRHLLRRGISNL